MYDTKWRALTGRPLDKKTITSQLINVRIIRRLGSMTGLDFHRDDLPGPSDQVIRLACQAQVLVIKRFLDPSPQAGVSVDDPSSR